MLEEFKSILFLNKDICYLCKEKIRNNNSYICIDCSQNLEIINGKSKIDFEYMSGSYYSLSYNRFTREKLRDYKFNGNNYLYKPFGEIMVNTFKKVGICEEIDLILFVPSHRKKEAMRGYNQAELLGKYMSTSLNKPLSRKNLVKVKHTKDQSGLNKLDRRLNLRETFKIFDKERIKGKNILLIDDIITTGATLEEVSKILLNNGVRKVIGLTLTTSKL